MNLSKKTKKNFPIENNKIKIENNNENNNIEEDEDR